jgi:predicted TIM-barrel fold metal-dependent hydrolase
MLRLFSADDHIIEPANVWQDRVASKFKEAAPRVIEEDGREYWVYAGTRSETMGLNAVVGKPQEERDNEPVRFSDMRPGCYDPKERAKDLLSDGIYASVLFPTLPRFSGTLFVGFEDKQLADACVKAYNDFVIDEWCPAGPPGLYVPTIISQLWDPELAAAEIHRCADRGARALSFPENPSPLGLPSYWTSDWDPVWRSCQERDIVLCLHIGTSTWRPTPSPDAPYVVTTSLLQVGSIMSSVNLMMSPVCRNFPGLKFVFSEGGIGWAPNTLERADRFWVKHSSYSGLSGMLPSEIFQRNMYLCMVDEPIGLKYRHDIGIDHILWECDYPHNDTTWPDSQQLTVDTFQQTGCTPEEIEAITHGNSERIFNWTMAKADATVD